MPASDSVEILVVEDEAAIRRGLCDVLAFRGFAPTGVERGDEGLTAGLAGRHALVILDVMLPGESGFAVCEQLRAARPRLPILMLTARGAEEDVLEGFRAGADDYVTKPFSVAELCARVEALLRRSGALAGEAAPPGPFDFGPWRLDPATLRASCDGDAAGSRAEDRAAADVELTPRELELLRALAAQPGRIVSRRSLLQEVWGYPEPERVETRTVDMHVAKLRRKLAGADPALIETVRGEGYRYRG